MKRILAIDGGGIKGVFPASFLATIEDTIGDNVANYFDLIAGTSTGGIIALGLGLGFSAKEILTFYEELGATVFKGNSFLRFVRQLGFSKYSQQPLKMVLESKFGERRFGESNKRLVIPSLNLETGEVYIYKTSHHPRLERDYKVKAVDIALATAAAPTYFPTYHSATGTPLIDGGMWANNPVGMAVVEAIGVLNWPRNSLKVLSLGCTTTPLNVGWGRRSALGFGYWGLKIADVFMAAQSSASLGTAQLLIDHENIVRISPHVERGRFTLDTIKEIPSLMGLGDSEARKALPLLRQLFFTVQVEQFEPYNKLDHTELS
jgi:hypothetical protein